MIDTYPPLSFVDILAFSLIALGAVRGLWRGLSSELARLISVVIALFVGVRYYQPVGHWVLEHSRLEGRPAFALAFVSMILAIVVFTLLIRFALKNMMKVVVEPEAERIGGLIAGTVHALVMVVIIFATLCLVPHPYINQKFGEESVVGTAVMRALPEVQALIDDTNLFERPDDDTTRAAD